MSSSNYLSPPTSPLMTVDSYANLPAEGQTKTLSGAQELARRSATMIEYLAKLHITSRTSAMRLSGVVCTIGPVTQKVETLVDMIDAGMNVARLNFSHGDHAYHGKTIENVRKASELVYKEKKFHPCVSIALDTKGPEIRTGLLEGDDGRKEITLETGDRIKLTTDEAYKEKCSNEVLYLDYKNLPKVLQVGRKIFLDDGLISVIAKEIGDDHIIGEVENGGKLGSRKGCNLPGTESDLPAVSEKDRKDLLFGVEQGVDMIFASFIRDAQGVRDIRKVLGEKGKKILIIPKIENHQGVLNIDEIIEESDGIMVARGDMGIELPAEKVFVAQKAIIAKCNMAGKPVICATQMLESMVHKPRPTRAEASDVANAVLDGADCVMLSGETAKGDYPLACIRTMARLAQEAESCLWNERFFEDIIRAQNLEGKSMDATHSTALAAVQASYSSRASAILAITTTGRTAKLAAKYRPTCPILGITRDLSAAKNMTLHRGVLPIFYPEERLSDWIKDIDERIQFAVDFGKKNGFIKTGDTIVCITGWRKGAGSSNTVRLLNVN